MLRWIRDNIFLSIAILLFAGLLFYSFFGWTPRSDEAKVLYFNQYFPLKGETIVKVEGLDVTSGTGIRGKKRFIVTSETGAEWLYKAEVIFKVLPGQIGPAYRITKVNKILISGPPEN